MAPKSALWKFFTKISSEIAECNICSKRIKTSKNTTNQRNHLRQKHREIFHQYFDASTSNTDPSTSSCIKKRKIDISDNIYREKVNDIVQEQEQDRPDSPASTILVQSETDPCQSTLEYTCQPTRFGMSEPEPGPSTSHDITKECSNLNQQSISTKTILKQPTITKTLKDISAYSDGGTKNVKITDAIVKFIVQDNLPFRVVEGQGFLNLLKEIAPLYKVPSRNTIKDRIDKKYDAVANLFKSVIKDIKYFVITTDIWTSDVVTKSYMGVTIHFIKDVEICSATLDVSELSESHTAEYISTELSRVFNKWEIDFNNIVAIVTDNGANIVKACQDLLGRNKHVPCFAHTINLVCENSIKNTKDLTGLIEKVRTITVWFKRSIHASDKLRNLQKNNGILEGNLLKLILDVKTRWNSTYFMIERFLKLAPLIGNIILNNVNAPDMISATEMEELKQILQLLRPLEQTTKEMSGQNYITLSKVIPMVQCLMAQYRSFKTTSTIAQNLKTAILKELEKRFANSERCFLLAAATILDPRFKTIHFKDPMAHANILKNLKFEMNLNKQDAEYDSSSSSDISEQRSDGQSFDLWAHHKNIAHKKSKRSAEGEGFDEIHQYLSVPVCNLRENPLDRWDEMKTVYPKLYKLSQKYLGVLATSVPSERLFSKAGATLTKNRNRLNGKRMSKLIFLSSLPKKFLVW